MGAAQIVVSDVQRDRRNVVVQLLAKAVRQPSEPARPHAERKVKGGRKFDEEFQTPVFLTADNLKPFFTTDLDGNSKPIFFTYGGTARV